MIYIYPWRPNERMQTYVLRIVVVRARSSIIRVHITCIESNYFRNLISRPNLNRRFIFGLLIPLWVQGTLDRFSRWNTVIEYIDNYTIIFLKIWKYTNWIWQLLKEKGGNNTQMVRYIQQHSIRISSDKTIIWICNFCRSQSIIAYFVTFCIYIFRYITKFFVYRKLVYKFIT